MHPSTTLPILLLLAIAAAPAGASEPVMIELPDSVTTIYGASRDNPLPMPTQEVRARRVVRELGTDRVEIGRGLLGSRDGGSVADLAPLLPSTHLSVNSRGEALFMVRGSSERHLRVELDGIPLTVPWDERVDLSLLPLIALGEVAAQRGVGSALDPPNALAGLVRLRTAGREAPGWSTRLGASHGEVESWRGQLRHLRRDGAWTTLLAAEHRTRDAFLLPASFQADFNQPADRRARLNSDLQQIALLARVGRDLPRGGGIRLLVQASDAEKGVPPETHLDGGDPTTDDPRLWRYPEVQRLLVGLSAELRPDANGRWELDGVLSFDAFEQDIREFGDSSYTGTTLAPGADFEQDRDRTWLGRARVARRLGDRWELAARGTVRHARHRETLAVEGPELEYVQVLSGAGVELNYRPKPAWRLRLGGAWEAAATPETGDKPSRESDHEPVLFAAVEQDLAGLGKLHATASRRSRFPSLREMFSGALGRFVVNPELRPERQTAVEVGWTRTGRAGELTANLFGQWIDGAIERVSLPGGGRQRQNLDEVRNLGVELGAVWRPLRGVSLDLQHTFLHSRSLEEGDWAGRVEDRPDWLSTFGAAWTHASGFQARVEGVGVGPRGSLDTRPDAPTSGLSSLDADVRINARLSWRHFGSGGLYGGSEWFMRVDNLLDELTWSQLGLPESGRMVRAGVSVDLER